MKIKKIFALILVLCFVLTYAGVFVVSAEDVNNEMTDSFKNVLWVLQLLDEDIMSADYETAVTRGKLAEIAAGLVGLSDYDNYIVESVYSDVSADSKSAAAISYLTSIGALSGYQDGTFRPEKPIKFRDSVKVLMDVMGYGVFANSIAPYPTGYLSKASSVGLLKNAVCEDYGVDTTVKDIIILIYDSLDINIYDKISFGSDKYELREKNPMISEYHDIYKYSGVIIDNGYSSLSSGSDVSSECAVIHDKKSGKKIIFEKNGIDIESLLGYNVDLYVRQGKDSDRGTAVYCSKGTNREKTVYDYQIVSYKNNTLTYCVSEDNGKNAELKTAVNLNVIRNGMALYDFTPDDFLVKDGFLSFVDSDSNGTYDLVIINEYNNVIFREFNEATGIIADHFSSMRGIDTDIEGVDTDLRFFLNGEIISPDMINEWDVVSAFVSDVIDGMRIIRCYVTRNELYASASSVEKDRIVIAGTEYRLSDNYMNSYRLMGEPKAGELSRFITDVNGKIAGIKSNDGAKKGNFTYAYLLGMKIDANTDETKIKVFTENGRMEECFVATKFVLDGNTVKTPSSLVENLKKAKYGLDADVWDDDISQLIKFKLNDEGYISAIDTSLENTGSGIGELVCDVDSESLDYSIYGLGSFGGKIIFGNNDLIFNVPADKSDYDKYRIISSSSLGDGNYDASIYDRTDDGKAGAVVIFGDCATALDNDSRLCVVEKISTGVDKDGMPAKILKFVMADGTSSSGIVTEDTKCYDYRVSVNKKIDFSDLHSGDAVRISYSNSDGSIVALERMLDITKINDESIRGELTLSGEPNGKFTESLRIVAAKPMYSFENSAKVSVLKPAGADYKEVFWSYQGTSFILCSQKADGNFIVKPGSTEDILNSEVVGDEEASLLFARTRYGSNKEIIIYNFCK